MSKLIIPVAELIGTPLTPEELKTIIAGNQNGGLKCTCSFEGTTTTSIKNSMDECAGWCSNECHNKGKVNWSATYSGITKTGD